MKQYKHYSFDLWLTLIKSNPLFKQEKAKYFFEHFNRDKKSLEEVTGIIRDVDVMCNGINQSTMFNIHCYEMYAMILHRLNYDYSSFIQQDFRSIENVMHGKFMQYSPSLYDNDTASTLWKLRNKGSTLSLLSNTGFIQSYRLDELLKRLGIYDYFSFTLYSDTIGSSKPGTYIFLSMTEMIQRKSIQGTIIHSVNKEDILHVGDNPIADFKGAQDFGIDAMIINSNDKTIKDLL